MKAPNFKNIKTASKKTCEVNRMEIKNEKLYIDGYAIGDEERLIEIFDKANKYDELKASFEGGDSQ